MAEVVESVDKKPKMRSAGAAKVLDQGAEKVCGGTLRLKNKQTMMYSDREAEVVALESA